MLVSQKAQGATSIAQEVTVLVDLPQARLSEAMSLVLRPHDPIVLRHGGKESDESQIGGAWWSRKRVGASIGRAHLDDERSPALTLHSPFYKVLEAVWEEPWVHHCDGQICHKEL